jgi:hypothetical protein
VFGRRCRYRRNVGRGSDDGWFVARNLVYQDYQLVAFAFLADSSPFRKRLAACWIASHRRTPRELLHAHAVEGVAKAILSRMTNVKAGGYEGAAFTRLFSDDAFRTRRKVLNSEGRRRGLRHRSCKEAGEGNGTRSHIMHHQKKLPCIGPRPRQPKHPPRR